FLTERFADFERYFGPDHRCTSAALQDGTPEASSAALLGSSVLADSAQTARAVAEDVLAGAPVRCDIAIVGRQGTILAQTHNEAVPAP
ncbi:MAG: hypothetical protein ABFS30_13455, partial [Pseudomonadota bacterium]